MNVNSVYGSGGAAAMTGVGAVAPSGASEGGSATSEPAASASFSSAGQLFSGMQQLEKSNPTEFKAVAAQVATNFQQAAGQATGHQAEALTKLASAFTQAAQTGAFPPPPQGGAPHMGGAHHHHGGGMGGGGAAMAQAFEGALGILDQATAAE